MNASAWLKLLGTLSGPDIADPFSEYTKLLLNEDVQSMAKLKEATKREAYAREVELVMAQKERAIAAMREEKESAESDADLKFAHADALTRTLKNSPPSNPCAEIELPDNSTPLEIAAAQIVGKFKDTKETFMLTSPMQLTVFRNGKFSKEAHIGAEDFEPLSAYAGKRGEIILTFKPVMTASYLHMEMSMSEAKKHLAGFREYAAENLVDCMEPIAAAKREVEQQKAAAEIEEKSETYKEMGYGSW